FNLEQAMTACGDAFAVWRKSSLRMAVLARAGRLPLTDAQEETIRQQAVSTVYSRGTINAFEVEKIVDQIVREENVEIKKRAPRTSDKPHPHLGAPQWA